ncbi:23S rRNA (pseudouridine(1915)-N(3))-methyltransferase RlmH [candidate division KSB1 bacterium]|nr:23S rRNA (pseudouridine(1915)-N(3))-methyltransferase RlmH [candidate division KSB1 bacterium]RQW01526.1 MAG: 23S rRNA (pseudouridine(1915)-N(3))-methyltransferase RlmH [candidate division KSB1 bacterium]
MKIRLLLVGKIENGHIKALAELYCERISHYAAIEIDVIRPEKIKNMTVAELLKREGERILAKLSTAEYTVVCEKGGKQFSSEEYAAFFDRLAAQGRKQVTFVIGGPLGIANKVQKEADEQLSLSRMTFPHELVAVVLLEQIYRAHTILRGENYHK